MEQKEFHRTSGMFTVATIRHPVCLELSTVIFGTSCNIQNFFALHAGFLQPGMSILLSLHCCLGGLSAAQWEDITGANPLTLINDCVQFTTNISARYGLQYSC